MKSSLASEDKKKKKKKKNRAPKWLNVSSQ